MDKLEWWKKYTHDKLPHWSAACKLILLVKPSSVPTERVFFFAVVLSKPLHWRSLCTPISCTVYLCVFEQMHTIDFCCSSCHFAAVYALKPLYYNTCADLKGGIPEVYYWACWRRALQQFHSIVALFLAGGFLFLHTCSWVNVYPPPPPPPTHHSSSLASQALPGPLPNKK